MAIYRIYRSGGELGVSSGFVAIGAAFATALVYEVWLFDVNVRTRADSAFDAHPWVVLGFVIVPLLDTASHFALPDQWGAQTVWMLLSIVLAMEYITLVGNVSLFFGTDSISDGGSRAPGWTHKYPGFFAKGECVFSRRAGRRASVSVCGGGATTGSHAGGEMENSGYERRG